MEYLKTLPIRLVPGWPGPLRDLSRLTGSIEIPSLPSAVGVLATRPSSTCTSPFPRLPARYWAGIDGVGLHRAHHGRLLLALLPDCQFSREPDANMDCDYRVVRERDW